MTQVSSVSFAANGIFLASGALDGTVGALRKRLGTARGNMAVSTNWGPFLVGIQCKVGLGSVYEVRFQLGMWLFP